mmetsp:Transcript_18138/g.54787  ORF Transcript_18138/g.54787 Transcript_18138/m.54787 type:complete len:219 (+) Transcript_18138:1029-1685(+)
MHELPASLLPHLLGGGHLVVRSDVPMQRSQQDHGHHAREEEQDEEGVEDGEPVDLPARHLQVHVPPRSPAYGAFRPPHVVGEEDLVMLVEVEGRRALLAGRRGRALGVEGLAPRLHLEAHDPVAHELLWVRVVLQVEGHVVVHEVPAVLQETYEEAVHVRELSARSAVSRGRGQVVHDPVHNVFVLDHAPELVFALRSQLLLAELLAGGILQHADLVG